MPLKLKRDVVVRSKFLTRKDASTGEIISVIAPNGLQIGLSGSTSVTGEFVSYGNSRFYEGLSGSLTQLVDGTSYLVAGSNVTISSASNGAVTISATGGSGSPGGSDTYVQFNDGGAFGGDAGFTYNKTTDTVTVAGAVTASLGLSGSLTRLVDGTSYLIAGTNVTISSVSNGPITISASGGSGSPGGSDGNVQFNNAGSFGGENDFTYDDATNDLVLSGTINVLTASIRSTDFAGSVNLIAASDLATDLTFTLPEADGSKFQFMQTDSSGILSFDFADRVQFNVRNNSGYDLDAGTPVYVTGYSAGNDRVLIAASSASNPSTMPAAGILSQDLVNNSNGKASSLGVLEGVNTTLFSEGDTLYVGVNGGLQNTRPTGFTDLIQNIAFVLESATNGTLGVRSPGRTNDTPNIVTATGGFSGSLTRLSDGNSYLIAGSNVTISSVSNGSVTISSTQVSPAGADTQVQFNDGGVFGGDDGLTFNKTTNDLKAAGFVSASLGFSGSLTRLIDGTSYIIAGSGISVSSASNGAVTIGSTGAAPDDAQYLALSADATLTNERVFTPSTGLTAVDGGAGANYTLSIDDSVVATVSGTTFTGKVAIDAADLDVTGSVGITQGLTIGAVVNAGTDTDKFLVLDASNNVDFRTGDEVRSDIRAGTVGGTSTAGRVAYWSSTTDIAGDAGFLFSTADDKMTLGAGTGGALARLHVNNSSTGSIQFLRGGGATLSAELHNDANQDLILVNSSSAADIVFKTTSGKAIFDTEVFGSTGPSGAVHVTGSASSATTQAKLAVGCSSDTPPKTAIDVTFDYSTHPFENQLSNGEGGGLRFRFGSYNTSVNVVGKLCYLVNALWVSVAANNATAKDNLIAVALDKDAGADEGLVLLQGFVRIPSSLVNGTPAGGAPVYADNSNAGEYTATLPSTSGDVVRVVGYWVDSSGSDYLIYFNPDQTYVEVS